MPRRDPPDADCRSRDLLCGHGLYADPSGRSGTRRRPPAALRRALRRVRDGVALDVTEASVLLAARGEQLDELLAAAARVRDAGLRRRRAPGRRHLLPQGVRPAHAAVPRPLPLLHLRHRPAPAARGVPGARRGAGDRPGGRRAGLQGGAVHPRRPARGALARRRASGWTARGYHSTLEYVRACAIAVLEETGPAAAPQPRGHELGGAHAAQARRAEHGDDAGDHRRAAVEPSRAARTTAARTRSRRSGCACSTDAGRVGVPFTTGILHRHRRDPHRARRVALRDPRGGPRARARPGDDRPELPGQAGHGDGERPGRRPGRPGRHHRRRAAGARPEDAAAGAAEPRRRRVRAPAAGRASTTGAASPR